jgi:hypothetical protein
MSGIDERNPAWQDLIDVLTRIARALDRLQQELYE